jgi:hypothetical protein
MKNVAAIILIAVIFCCNACSGGSSSGKKVIVMSSGKMKQNAADPKTIDFEPGNQHNELTLELGADEKAVVVKTGDADKSYEIPDNGVYLLNLKADTMIGNQVNFGESGMASHINADQLQHIIDSTQQLMRGEGASDEKRTYFLVPNSIKKITANPEAQLLSPYKNIPYEVKVDDKGKAPEMYKFYTNSQKREALTDLLKRLNK